jgi:hypothetical protein
LALHLGWSYETLMGMDHFERRKWLDKALEQLGMKGEAANGF